MSPSSGRAESLEGLRLRLARSRTAPVIGLIGVLVAVFALNLWARHGDYFFYDEYQIVLHFYGLEGLLHPSNGHPVIMWLAPYYLMRSTIGLESALAYEVLGILAGLVAACLLFVAVRRRAGGWPALVAAILLLFIGSGVDPFFWSFELAFAGSVSCGLGAILLLDGDTRRGDALAAVLLIASVFFLLVGLTFVAAAAVAILLAADGRGWNRRLRRFAWVIGPVAILFVAWYLGYGHLSPSRLTTDNILASPGFVVDGLGATIVFILGLGVSDHSAFLDNFSVPVLLGTLALIGRRLTLPQPVSRRVWIWVVGLFAFWVLTAFNSPVDGGPTLGRYLYPSAVFMLLIAAELIRGLRLGLVAATLAAVVVLVAVLGGGAAVNDGRHPLNEEAKKLAANLGALEIARDTISPKVQLVESLSGTPFEEVVDAGSFFKSADRYGSPALSPEEILTQPEAYRETVDGILRAVLPVTLEAGAPKPATAGSCFDLEAGSGIVTTGSVWLEAGPEGATPSLRPDRRTRTRRIGVDRDPRRSLRSPLAPAGRRRPGAGLRRHRPGRMS